MLYVFNSVPALHIFSGSIHNILFAFYFIVSADSCVHKCKYRHTYSLCCGSKLEQSVALLLWC